MSRWSPAATNPAEGATVTASSSYEADGWAANAAVDGARTSTATSECWSSADNLTANHREWLQLDLGTARPLNRVDLYPRNDGAHTGAGFPPDFTIQVSPDTTTWTTVATDTNYPRPTTAARPDLPVRRHHRPLPPGHRHQPEHRPVGHYQMQFAEAEPVSGDLAAGRPVSTSSSVGYANESWLRVDATDGIRDSDLGYSMGWSSTGAATQHTEWMQVDLGGPTHLTPDPTGAYMLQLAELEAH